MKLIVGDAVPGSGYADPTFSQAVTGWQKQYGRHNLPWQRSKDPYRVWLSEIMLQQTQVTAVIPYYQKFLASFPDVESLARASSEQVMAHWSGLGYYTRARNLHACAKRVVLEYGGVFPDAPELLAGLPGIGRSTAAAIAAFSYGKRAAILDGNVKRVFTRVFGIDGYPGSSAVEQDLWLRAQALMPEADVGEIQSYTQGLMDLGATLCTRARPRCGDCPLQAKCVALATDRVAELPTRKPKKAIPTKQVRMLVLLNPSRQVLLEKRPATGIWGGLYSLPELFDDPAHTDEEVLQQIRQAAQVFGDVEQIRVLETFAHGFTHFKLEISPYACRLTNSDNLISEDTHVWLGLNECEGAPLPAPIKKLLMSLAVLEEV